MKRIGIGFMGILVVIIFILGLSWIIEGNEFFLYKYFAPKQEQVRRETFEQSKAFRQGMIQELQNMQFEYIKAEPKHKDALASIILHRAADVDENILPSDLRSFITGLRKASSSGL